MNKPKNLA
jgi:hypothetical protein